jgi:hypothetical protein
MAGGTPKWPLSLRILALTLLNLALVAIVLVAFAQSQFGVDLEGVAFGPGRDRFMAIGDRFARDLDRTPFTSRNELLRTYAGRYGMDVFLVDPDGQPLAGDPVKLPQKVIARVRGSLPPGGFSDAGRVHLGDDRGIEYSGSSTPRENGPPLNTPPEGHHQEAPPNRIPPGRLPLDAAFLTVTKAPLLYWVGIRIPTAGPRGERGIPGVLLLRTDSFFQSNLFFEWRILLGRVCDIEVEIKRPACPPSTPRSGR